MTGPVSDIQWYTQIHRNSQTHFSISNHQAAPVFLSETHVKSNQDDSLLVALGITLAGFLANVDLR